MTPEVEKKRSELFDAWYAEYTARGWDVSRVATWTSFNASLDAVEIDLPHAAASIFATSREARAASDGIDMCAAAITATGLGIRVK